VVAPIDTFGQPAAPEPPRVPARPPFAIRGRVVTPLDAGGTLDLPDAIVRVAATGRIVAVEPVGTEQPTTAGGSERTGPDADGPITDLRGLVVLPGFVDLHAHLPQVPNEGIGAGLDLLTWLERDIFPLERSFDEAAAAALVPAALRAFAAAGTTTLVAYSAVYAGSTDVAFQAAEAHGMRAVIGQVLMDRERYEARVPDDEVLDVSLRESAALIERWHGRDDGRLRYAVTPRFAVACSADLLRESAALASATGVYWQTHLAEDRRELATVAERFPEALDYLDVYDRAGALTERAILAHAIHLSDREIERLVASRAVVAHCPSSNLFLASGTMRLARYLEAGMRIGLGSDVAAGPDPSMLSVMRVGASVQNALRVADLERRSSLDPLGWLRLGTLEGARALSLGDDIGSLEVGKEADLIVVDPAFTSPLPPGSPAPVPALDATADLLSRLMYRAHPAMVRAAWVRGRRLAGPAGWEPPADGAQAVPHAVQGRPPLDTGRDVPPRSLR
jgi:guanine deaminase